MDSWDANSGEERISFKSPKKRFRNYFPYGPVTAEFTHYINGGGGRGSYMKESKAFPQIIVDSILIPSQEKKKTLKSLSIKMLIEMRVNGN